MDLVANHTAIDSPLTSEHPDWYVHDEHGEILRPFAWHEGKKVIWGDLAKLDHQGSNDRDGLREYFADVCCHYLDLGINGFRCDAAYQVPGAFWDYLLPQVKANYPDAIFLAESLGCSVDDACQLADNGFDYLFNSSKWWDYRGAWSNRFRVFYMYRIFILFFYHLRIYVEFM
jgi:starch synthase (maltosyl-transferring)